MKDNGCTAMTFTTYRYSVHVANLRDIHRPMYITNIALVYPDLTGTVTDYPIDVKSCQFKTLMKYEDDQNCGSLPT